MASILRSSKFLRYFTGLARNIVFNSAREVDNTLIQNSQCLNTSIARSFASATQIAPSQPTSTTLDQSLRRLDQDARRSGRISRRELEEVLGELRQSRSASSTQSLLIIRCCGNLVPEEPPQVRTQLVQEIWKTLDNLGVAMDISHYNALLRVYLENEHLFSPTDFLADLEKKGVEPNRVTYQRLISRYCQQGDIEGATRILEFMREKQLPVNESVFNSLIMGHSQADDMESAAGILGVMAQAGLEPSADTYTTLLCGYARAGDIDTLLSTLDQADSKDVYMLDKDYLDVVYALAVNGQAVHVERVLSRVRRGAGYNQDALNLILRLVNQGYEDLALILLRTMPRPIRPNGEEQLPTGAFLVKQLVKAGRPVEKIISVCEGMEAEGLHPRALLVAAEMSLQLGNTDQAFHLLTALKARGFPIRQHYFWPLLAACNKNKDTLGVLSIVQRMAEEFGLPASSETLRDFVTPSLLGQDVDQTVTQLRSAGVSPAAAASSLVFCLLSEHRLAEAAEVAGRYRAFYSPMMMRRPLVLALQHSKDTASYIRILRQIHDGVDRFTEGEEGVVPDRAELVGQFLLDAAAYLHQDRAPVIHAILQGLVTEGLSISNSSAEKLQDKLGGVELTAEMSGLLAQLTAGDLIPATVNRPPSLGSLMSPDEGTLKRIIAGLEAKGEPAQRQKRQLFTLYCRSKDMDGAMRIKQELETEGFLPNEGFHAQLMELYVLCEKLEEALDILAKIREKEPTFCVDDTKIIRLITLMAKNNLTQDALKLLAEQPRDRKLEEKTFTFNSLCWRLLNLLAEQGQAEEVKAMLDALVAHEYVEVNNVLLGPLIKVHLVKGDLGAAIAEFERCCNQYRSTPWKNELTCKLIEAEDAAALQTLTDLSTQIHGEVNSLYDLVFAFVECGRIRQARKILETPGLRSRPQRLNSICERYRQEGLVAPLEGLVEATKDIGHINRAELYHHLLLFYRKSNDLDKALGLWMQMQEEDVQPSDEFLRQLGHFLREHGRAVPFVVPAPPTVVSPPVLAAPRQTAGARVDFTTSGGVFQFRQALKDGDLDQALEIKQRIESEGKEVLAVANLSLLVENLVKAERLGDACKLVQSLLGSSTLPFPRVLRYLLNNLAVKGDVAALATFSSLLSPEQKKLLSFDNRVCHANIVAGRASEYLDSLQKELESAPDEDLAAIAEKFPRGGAAGILDKHPELCPTFERMALKFAARGIETPVNVLWVHLFVSGKEAAAEKLWNEFLAGKPRIMFQRVLQVARERGDVGLVHALLARLQGAAVSEGALGNAYSCLVDILNSQEKFDESLISLDSAVKEVCLENLNRTALIRLQEGLAKQGKPFPYTIPSKNAKSSSSSSSSDDEAKPKRKVI